MRSMCATSHVRRIGPAPAQLAMATLRNTESASQLIDIIGSRPRPPKIHTQDKLFLSDMGSTDVSFLPQRPGSMLDACITADTNKHSNDLPTHYVHGGALLLPTHVVTRHGDPRSIADD